MRIKTIPLLCSFLLLLMMTGCSNTVKPNKNAIIEEEQNLRNAINTVDSSNSSSSVNTPDKGDLIDPLLKENDKNIVIPLNFREFEKSDNSFPEDLKEVKDKDILTLYKSLKYKGINFIVFRGYDKGLHIGYSDEDKYYSICSIADWDSAYDKKTSEQRSLAITINNYENVLGTSGLHFYMYAGAAARNEFYIYIDPDSNSPRLLLSYCTGGFLEADINGDNEKELLSSGGGIPTNFFLMSVRDNKLMWTDYLYYEKEPVFYDSDKNMFYIKDNSNIKTELVYDEITESLIEK